MRDKTINKPSDAELMKAFKSGKPIEINGEKFKVSMEADIVIKKPDGKEFKIEDYRG